MVKPTTLVVSGLITIALGVFIGWFGFPMMLRSKISEVIKSIYYSNFKRELSFTLKNCSFVDIDCTTYRANFVNITFSSKTQNREKVISK